MGLCRIIRCVNITRLEHLPKGIVASERCGEGSGVEPVPAGVGMIIQRNNDPLADHHVVPGIRLVVKYQLPAGTPVEPTVYPFQGVFINLLKVAVLLKTPWLCSNVDVVAAVPVFRLNGADLVVLHLAAAILGVGAIPAAKRAAMDAVEAESVHICHHSLIRAGRDHPIRSPPTLMPRMAFSMICSPTFSAISS